MERLLHAVIWYGALILGAKRVYSFAIEGRNASQPLEKARHSASAFLVCGQLLWVYAVLDDARREINWAPGHFRIGDVLSVLGGAAIWAIFLIGPMWLTRRMLAAPRPGRCRFAAFIARAVAAFAAAVICVAPIMFSFAGSLSQFVNAVMSVAIPMLILIYTALKTGKLASRAADTMA